MAATEIPMFWKTEAVFSRPYRYRLRYTWQPELTRVCFVMCNPSVATEAAYDPTVRRCCGFAHDWQFGGLDVVNLFALISTDPKALYAHPAPTGPRNDSFLVQTCTAPSCGRVVAAWGTHGAYLNRGAEVLALLAENGVEVWCLGKTKSNFPVHPLYIPASRTLERLTP